MPEIVKRLSLIRFETGKTKITQWLSKNMIIASKKIL